MKAQITTTTTMAYDDAGKGRPVVLLHAFPFSRAMWRPQVEALRDDHRVLTPDLRGFGGTSPFEQAPSVEQMADDVAGLLDTLKLGEPVVLGGLSMGGYVALAFARRNPSRLRALILADTRAEPDNAEGKANRDKLIAFAQRHTPRDVIDSVMPKMVSAETRSQRPEVVEEVRRIASAQTPAGIVGALQALRDRPDATASLGALRVPTLVLVGSEDALTPPAMSETLATGIAGARLVKIPGAGHLSNLEQPAAFNAAVRSFLQSLVG
jgi:3-oxoadipate enol-lactonase